MRNSARFSELLPAVLRSVPYIHQSHVFKAYCALENLYALRPQLPDEVWEHCARILREDEPKVDGLIAGELLELPQVLDRTSGRDFGPDWILEHGLMPMSYWAIQRKYEETGFEALIRSYLSRALDHPRFLGHELSVLSGHWQFYRSVLSSRGSVQDVRLYLQRFTEYAVTTFHGANDPTFPHPEIHEVPREEDILEEALRNPGFFGHNVLACVWTRRLQALMSDAQVETSYYNLTVMNRWEPDGQAPAALRPLNATWGEQDLDEHLTRFFLEGPTNIHQVTLAEALVSVWSAYPNLRPLCATNLLGFTRGVQPA